MYVAVVANEKSGDDTTLYTIGPAFAGAVKTGQVIAVRMKYQAYLIQGFNTNVDIRLVLHRVYTNYT